jgi:hypothetical protein
MQLQTLTASLDTHNTRAVYAEENLTPQYIPVSVKKARLLLTAAKDLEVCLKFRCDSELP